MFFQSPAKSNLPLPTLLRSWCVSSKSRQNMRRRRWFLRFWLHLQKMVIGSFTFKKKFFLPAHTDDKMTLTQAWAICKQRKLRVCIIDVTPLRDVFYLLNGQSVELFVAACKHPITTISACPIFFRDQLWHTLALPPSPATFRKQELHTWLSVAKQTSTILFYIVDRWV